MSVLRLQGALLLLLRESLQTGPRSYSSTWVKEEARRRWVSEQAELLELLEARVKQLQAEADNVSEVAFEKVHVSQTSWTRFLRLGQLQGEAVPGLPCNEPFPKSSTLEATRPSRWKEKLKREKMIKHKRELRLEAKFSIRTQTVLTDLAAAPNQVDQSRAGQPARLNLAQGQALKPAQGQALKPAQGQALKPDQGQALKPAQGQALKPARGQALKPARGQAVNPAQGQALKPARGQALKPARGQALKPARGQAVKPAQGQAVNPAEASELQNDAKAAKVRDPSAEECPPGLPQDSPAPGDLQKHVVSLQKAPTEMAGRYRNSQLTLLAYLDACIFLNQLDRAQQCLMFYHRSLKRQKHLDIHAYNLLLHAYAKQGSLHEVCFVFSLLEQAGLTPNRESYIAALSCMGRSNAATFITSRCLKQLQESHICLEDLFRDSVLEDDEVEMALKAIRKVKPDFSPSLPHYLHETCTIPLIQNFYTKKNEVSYPKLNFTVRELQEKFQKQLAMESSDTVAIDSVEAGKPVTNHVVQARKQLATLRSLWQTSLLQSLWKSKMHIGQRKPGPNLLPFLSLLEDKVYVDILVQAASQIPPQGESLTTFARDLGSKVYNKYTLQKKCRSRVVEKMQQVYRGYVQLLAKDGKPNNLLPREYWEQLATEAGCSPSLFRQELPWPHSLLVQIGLHLVELLVQELKMPSNLLSHGLEQRLIPVLYHVYSFRSGRQTGFIKPHPLLTRLLLNAAETTLTFDSYVIPTLCPPVPWVSPHFGAYILSSTRLMRSVEEAAQHQLLLEQVPRSDLFPVMDALNQLGNCPWRINGAILDVIVSLFNDKGDEKLGVPPPPSEAPQPLRTLPDGKPLGQLALKREMARCHKKAMEMYSLRMNGLYKLSIAQHMRDQTFWFPHNMDFRGRTYPCPPHLNHLGSDLSRAILSFAEGKPLGPHGLNWLKIHLVNLTGLKKKNSLRDRLCYANEIMDDILDSADRPLTGKKWWMNTDEPWQVLACCMEIAQAVRSPDPAAYVSHFPVHQDGSCNGLQHYAALGRDAVGAASVNLMPSAVPQDVYSGVAQKVEEFRKLDASQGSRIAQVLEGFITRKVVKQTVMTVVYGVTRYGGRLQIEKRLKEIDDFPPEYVWEASFYLVQKVFNSLKEMFSATREIQAWLTESARMIAKSGWSVEWVTPLGLPVIQPYHRTRSIMVNSNMQKVLLNSQHDINQKPNTVKQKNAFPPNFIHSLDSTHMMLTALHCHRRGLVFVSVHDCYWTHAVTVDIMNEICREQFVMLHSQPILEDLSKFMVEKYCTNPDFLLYWKNKKEAAYWKLVNQLSNVPGKGDFDLQQVKKSIYFFS